MCPVLKDAAGGPGRHGRTAEPESSRSACGRVRHSIGVLCGSSSRAGSTDFEPNFAATLSRTCSAARQLSSRRSRLSCSEVWAASSSCSALTPDKADCHGPRAQRFEELNSDGIDQLSTVNRGVHGPAACDGGEIGVAEFEGDGPGNHSGASEPLGRPVRQTQQLPVQEHVIGRIHGERFLGTDALLQPDRSHRPGVNPPESL